MSQLDDDKKDLLPLRDDWRYISFNGGFDLAPGQVKVLFESKKKGYMMYGGIFANNPNLEWTVELETAGSKSRQVSTLLQLFSCGVTSPTPNGWWISKYDAIFSLYAIVFSPSTWWPFYGGIKFSVMNPTSGIIKVMQAGLLGIEFTK